MTQLVVQHSNTAFRVKAQKTKFGGKMKRRLRWKQAMPDREHKAKG